MKTITNELKIKLIKSNSIGLARAKWDKIFDNEQELIEAMFNERVVVENAPMYLMRKGYEYIKSFRRYYEKNGCLTDKQMTQLKRLASQIVYRIYC